MKANTWSKLIKAGLILISAAYILALFKIVLFKFGLDSVLEQISAYFGESLTLFRHAPQLVPFSFIADLKNPQLGLGTLLINILGNFALFIPMGILLPALFPRLHMGKTVLIGFLTSLAFEVFQYFFDCGMSDVDDLILNTLGCFVGAALYFGLFFRRKKLLRAQVISFIFLAVFGLCGLLSLWLLSPSTLPAQIEYVNEEVLEGIDTQSYDLSGRCLSLENGTLHFRENSVSAGETNPAAAAAASYELSENAVIIIQRHSYQFSPNGNIQKTTVTYELGSEESAAKVLAENDGGFADFWLDGDGRCSRIILTIL